MRCNKCGNEDVQGGRFCIHCGNDMSFNQSVNNNGYQSTYNQTVHNTSNQIRKVSKSGTIVLLVFSIILFNIIGIVLCIVALSKLGNADNLPEGLEKESNLKTAKVCKIIALILCILQAVISFISLIFVIVSFGIIFNSVDTGNVEFNENIEYEDNYVISDDKLECVEYDSTLGEVTYTFYFEDGIINKLSGSMEFDITDYEEDYIETSMSTLGCDEAGTTCTIDKEKNKLLYVSTISGSTLNEFLSDGNLNTSSSKELIKKAFEQKDIICK